MPQRVLLISSNRCDQPYPVFPLGLTYVDTALRRAGHETRLWDYQIAGVPLEQVLAEFAPDYIGISCRNVDDIVYQSQETYFDLPAQIIQRVRAMTKCPVVLGGSAFSLYPEKLLELTGANYGVVGEGERAFVELLAGNELSRVPGLVWRNGNIITINPCAPLDPRDIPFAERAPALEDFYLQRSLMLNIQTQRGCPLHCCYCTYPLIEGRQPRRRPAADVVAELADLAARGVKHVFIADSVFNTTTAHVTEICEAILQQGVTITWSCFLRPVGLTPELMRLMARAGLTHVEFGSDSFCDPVLREYGKSFTFADILESALNAQAAKVRQAHFLICGGPGETRETLQETFTNSRQLTGAVIFGFAGMRIFPGTALHERALREGVIQSDTDLLSPRYYISASLPITELLALLEDFKCQAANWIVGPLPPSFPAFADRLRQRGVVGPLWEYYTALKRMA